MLCAAYILYKTPPQLRYPDAGDSICCATKRKRMLAVSRKLLQLTRQGHNERETLSHCSLCGAKGKVFNIKYISKIRRSEMLELELQLI